MSVKNVAAPSGPPILDLINQKLPRTAEKDSAVARKHNCNSVWCPHGCYRRFHLPRHFARLSSMPWDEVRFVTLTLDREVVGEGADAYLFARAHKIIGRFFVDLKRLGVEWLDWAGQMEFHGDGTPHWHILVWMDKGRMIGQDNIHKAWPWGRMIKEEYFKTRQHYDRTVGYFGKTGYFHKRKKHQTILPDYFKSDFFKGKRVMRFLSARRPSDNPRPTQPKTENPKKSEVITAMKLQTCGEFVHIWYRCYDELGWPGGALKYGFCAQYSYKKFLNDVPGDFIPMVGYGFNLDGSPPEPCPF